MIEAEYQDLFVNELRKWGAYAKPLVGGMFNSGQPDITVTSMTGAISFVELKVWRGTKVPTIKQLLSLLKGPQCNVIIHQLWERKAPCYLIAFIAASDENCAYCDSSQEVHVDKWKHIAKLLAQT